jgi:hypothetical protein
MFPPWATSSGACTRAAAIWELAPLPLRKILLHRNKACFALFPFILGGRNMPALLGYLLALAIFLGGGYVGLEWLASPEDTSTVQRPNKKLVQNKNGPKKFAGAVAVPSEAEEKVQTPASTAVAKGSGQAVHEAPSPASGGGDLGNSENLGSVPAGGCTPIGLTARGDLVFPITCQELMERHRGPVAASSTTETAPSIKENRAAEPKERDKSSNAANQAAELPNDDATDMSRTDVPKIDETKPSEPTSEPAPTGKTLSGSDKDNQADLSHRPLGQVQPNDGFTPSAVKPGGQESAPSVKSGKPERQNLRTGRSKLVMMTLRTIEFPDGHREQHLLPAKHSQRQVDAADQWYNALGLR